MSMPRRLLVSKAHLQTSRQDLGGVRWVYKQNWGAVFGWTFLVVETAPEKQERREFVGVVEGDWGHMTVKRLRLWSKNWLF